MEEWDRKRDIMRRYDSTAYIYEARYTEEQTSKIEAAMKHVIIEEESLILDMGCGTGFLFDYVASKAKAAVGLDISRKILLQAKAHAKRFANTHLILADADNTPFKRGTFSHLFAVTLIQNMPDPVRTLDEAQRVTKEKAIMVITGLKKKFSIEVFNNSLRDAGLEVIALESEGLECHVAVCTKLLD